MSTENLESLHELEVAKLKDDALHWRAKHTEAIGQLREADSRLNAMLGLQGRSISGKPIPRIKATGRKGESVAVMVASDWHIEERVDPKTINGVNEYNIDIAKARLTKFFQRGLEMVEMARSRSSIDVLVLAVLGDLVTGQIHEDLAENNYLSTTEASLLAQERLEAGIDFLLKEGRFKKIWVPCNFGNHGRTTKKPRVATAAKNSYEWLMYHQVAKHYAKEGRVHFQIADGCFNFLEIYDRTLRLHHGDSINFFGGVGGVDIPLNKAIAQWNKMRHADIDVLGHWHTRKNSTNFVINGSVIGYNAYSIRIKASFEPPSQSFFLLHPERGKTVEIPIFVS